MKPCQQINTAVIEILLSGFAPAETVKLNDGLELRVYYFNLSAFGPLIFGVQTGESDPNVYLMSQVSRVVVFLGKRSDFVALEEWKRIAAARCEGEIANYGQVTWQGETPENLTYCVVAQESEDKEIILAKALTRERAIQMSGDINALLRRLE